MNKVRRVAAVTCILKASLHCLKNVEYTKRAKNQHQLISFSTNGKIGKSNKLCSQMTKFL